MPKITTFLTFADRAEEAVKLYCSVFEGSRIKNTTYYGDAGPGPKGSPFVIEFEMLGQDYIAMNGGEHFKFTDGISLAVMCKSQQEVDYYWDKLTAGGKEIACGWLVDRFGVSWQIVPTEIVELMTGTDPKKVKSVMEAVMKMKKIDIAAAKTAYAKG